MLENLVIVNESNESFSLAELSDKNVSNPVNRKNELMTRMAGYEDIAKVQNHKALFVTITCPSRFHNTYAKSGDRNPKWDGSTPYEAQHDDTPHWHMLIFLEQTKRTNLKTLLNTTR